MPRPLDEELARRLTQGQERVSLETLVARYAQLGYHFDRRLDCRAPAIHLTGPWAGASYPCLALYPVQSDNGLSAWHIEARRDAAFQSLQQLRKTLFSVSAGHIVDI